MAMANPAVLLEREQRCHPWRRQKFGRGKGDGKCRRTRSFDGGKLVSEAVWDAVLEK